MTNQLSFPKIEHFSLSVSRNEPLSDTRADDILLIAEANAEIILSRRIFSLSKGDVLLALPYSYLRLKEDVAFPGYAISFSKDFLCTACPNLYFNYIDDGIALSFQKTTALCLLNTASELLEGRREPIHALPIIFSILENEALPQTDICIEIPLPSILRRALTYIEETVPALPDSVMLAARYGISQTTLLRLFRKHLATTPRKYAQALQALYEQKNGVI